MQLLVFLARYGMTDLAWMVVPYRIYFESVKYGRAPQLIARQREMLELASNHDVYNGCNCCRINYGHVTYKVISCFLYSFSL